MGKKNSFFRYLKSRLPIFLILICVIAAAVASGVMGKYVADKNDEAAFEVIAEPKLELEVSAPDASGNYTITNLQSSNMPSFVRFTVVVNWKSDNHNELWFSAPVEGTDYTVDAENCTKIGKYYYYNGEVAVGASFNIKVTPDTTKEGYTMEIKVLSEAIQSVPDSAVQDAWGVEFNETNWTQITN